jgi:hydroxymethylglutaryl-CoA synthase
VLRPDRQVGIVGWGVYVPMYRIRSEELARAWGRDWKRHAAGIMVEEKSVPGIDEDTFTIAYEAASNAIRRARIDPSKINAVYVGTESKPYAVKPTSTILAEALGIGGQKRATTGADFEFACKAGTEAMQAVIGLVGSNMIDYGLVVGADTAQGAPGDALEYTASSGGAAFVIGPAEESVAIIKASCSYVTDTPDFWRRQHERYPAHTRAFTGEPAYFHHIIGAARMLMEEIGTKPEDYDYAVFHQPNGKFPLRVGQRLGFPPEKIKPGLITPYIGNTYSGSSLIGLSAILDIASPGQRILVVSFGSGAGSDAFHIEVTDKVEEVRDLAPRVIDYVNRKKYVDYTIYARNRRMITLLKDFSGY